MILVTGASGTVGSEVVKALGAFRARVRAGYRTRPQNVPEGVESVALEYDRPDTLRPAMKDVETLFLVSNSITPELTVVDEARHAGVKRIVKLSVLRAAEEGYIFARWHRAVERHIEASGLAWTFLRSNGFMQNVVTYMGETIRTQSAFYSSGGDGAASHIDVRDLGAVAASVLVEMGHEGQAYELTGPVRDHVRADRGDPDRRPRPPDPLRAHLARAVQAGAPGRGHARALGGRAGGPEPLLRRGSRGRNFSIGPPGHRPRRDPVRAVRARLRGQAALRSQLRAGPRGGPPQPGVSSGSSGSGAGRRASGTCSRFTRTRVQVV